MVVARLIVLFILAGCAAQGPSLDELELQLFACDRDKVVNCEPLRQELDRKFDKIERIKKKRQKEREDCAYFAKCYYGEDMENVLRGMQRPY